MSQLAGVVIAGTVHDAAGSHDAAMRVELFHDGAGATSLMVVPGEAGSAYELPVDALKVAIAALPLRELLRVVREARA